MMTMMMLEFKKKGEKLIAILDGEVRDDWGTFDHELEGVAFARGWIGGCVSMIDEAREQIDKGAGSTAAAELRAVTLRVERDTLRNALAAILDASEGDAATVRLKARALLDAVPRVQ